MGKASERRRSRRIQLERLNRIVLAGDGGLRLSGVVEDVSRYGLRLEADSGSAPGDLPMRFRLRVLECSDVFEDLLLGRECEVKWSRDVDFGLEFVDPLSDSLLGGFCPEENLSRY
jgi:hypothetical protein